MKIEKVSWEASHKSLLDDLNEVKNEQTMHDQIDFSWNKGCYMFKELT